MNEKLDIGKILVIFVMLFALFAIIAGTCQAQEPDLEGYSIEAWEANNEAWQLKYDSVAALNDQNCDSLNSVIDSVYYMYENMKATWLSCLDTSHHYGDHTLIIQDSINHNNVNVSTRGTDIWVDYYTNELRYHFFILERQPGDRSFEFWIGEYGKNSREVMKMDTSQFRVNYMDLKKYFE